MNPRKAGILLTGFATLGGFGVALWVHRFGRRERLHPAGAIVVLGARVRPGGVPSPSLVARVAWAAELYRRGVAPLVVLTGGAAQGGWTEAEVMKRLAVQKGIPEAACLLEQESRTTEENGRFSVRMLRERGISTCVVVSDGFHLFRARQIFRSEGIEPGLSPAPLDGRHFPLGDALYWTFREAFILLLRPGLLLQGPP